MPVALVVALVWVIAPEVISGTFAGPESVLRVGGVVAVLAGWVWLVRRLAGSSLAARAVGLVPVLAVGWWGLSPYVLEESADDEFPVAAVDLAAAPEPTAPTAAPTTPSTVSTPTTPAAPVEPRAWAQGEIRPLTGHRGAGTATLWELPDGTLFVRLENYQTGPGPDLDVYLVPGEDRTRPAEGSIFVADLDETSGNKNLTLPAGVDPAGSWTLLVWCESFQVEVSNATLTPL